jgi:hypothetical protein
MIKINKIVYKFKDIAEEMKFKFLNVILKESFKFVL